MLQTKNYKLLQLTFFVVWASLFVVGLWPFNFSPANRVEWLGSRNGIHLDQPGQFYSAVSVPGSHENAGTPGNGFFSIELWIQPDKVSKSLRTIVSTYAPGRQQDFRIEQSIADLVVRGGFLDSDATVRSSSLYVDDVFQSGGERFLTLTSGAQGTVIYLEGVRRKSVPYRLDPGSLSGLLVLGDTASSNRTWVGNLLGLAIYDRVPTDGEVLNHYQAWTRARIDELTALDGITALYPMDEKRGQLVHNRLGPMPDLFIPKTFQPLDRRFLDSSFSLSKSDLLDAAINILGFVPFGLLGSAYLQQGLRFPRYRAFLITILAGGLSSLFIECLQAYLPTRNSSLPDLINNILGTAGGAMLLSLVVRRPSSVDSVRSMVCD